MTQIKRQIQVGGHPLNYYLTYRSQKNIILRVREGQIFITAPVSVQDWEIEQIIYQNYPKINHIQNNYEVQAKYDFYGTKPWVKIFNQPVPIVLTLEKIRPKIVGGIIQMHDYLNNEQQLIKLYSFLAQQYQHWFINRTLMWAQKMDVEFKNVSVRVMNLKWGVCYPQTKKLIFNTKLLHFNPEIIDYVLVHELAHLTHPNHSRSFWLNVERIIPHYREIKKNLDNSGI